MKTLAPWILLAAPLAAQDVLLDAGDARLCEQEVDAEIQHRMAVTRVRQVFENPGNRGTEGVYSFRVPQESSLTAFTMWIADKTMKGQIVDREEARRIYDGIVAKARDPGIVEEIEPRVFRVRVFPIPPGGRMKFEVTYMSSIPFDGDSCSYVYPLRIDQRRVQTLERFSFDLRIVSAAPVLDVVSVTHSLNVDRRSEREVRVAFDGRTGLDHDIAVRYATGATDLSFLAHRESGQDGYFALFPGSNPWRNVPCPKEVVYLVDRSSSMSAKTLANLKELLVRSLQAVPKGDRVRVIAFNEATLPFEGDGPKELAKFLEPLGAEGRTDLAGAFQAALSPSSDRVRVVVVVSDGCPSAGVLAAPTLIAKTLAAVDRRTVIFGLGIGPENPERILETLCTLGGGEFIPSEGDLASAWDRLHRRLSRPFVTDFEIDWGDASVEYVHPTVPRLFFAGDQAMVVGRYRKAGRHVVTLRGTVGDRRVEIEQSLVFPDAEERWGCMAYLWAGSQIRTRLAEIAQGGDAVSLRREVVSLSNEYQIVTPYTAFLVLENDEMYAQYGLERLSANERRLFKRRSKKKLESIREEITQVDLVSAKPGVVPADPWKENPTLRGLKWLSNRPVDDPSSVDFAGNGRLDEVGRVALSVLALLGASGYEVASRDASAFEKAARGLLRWLEARQNADDGRIADASSDLLNHALATLALVRGLPVRRDSSAAAQRALSFLSDRPAKEWTRGSGTAAAVVRLAFAEARALGLELDESVLRFLPTREFRRENLSLQSDPLSAWIGTEILLTTSSIERRSWCHRLEGVLRAETRRVKSDGSWLPAKWNEKALPATTALRILTQEAYDQGD